MCKRKLLKGIEIVEKVEYTDNSSVMGVRKFYNKARVLEKPWFTYNPKD
ncbi:hypothetical protein DSOL_0054 [Desulfosporosinus metallidurans]|uniref:Uncharacterized protein n=1 Tax=Desulfosporosinus metallidurans TaxID=1888891 RepID=A0A1Q8R2N7_9FIRM|nr:hypothetical protein DSOL_0054 [Desulfosporosinus metallidurans]